MATWSIRNVQGRDVLEHISRLVCFTALHESSVRVCVSLRVCVFDCVSMCHATGAKDLSIGTG